MKYTALYSRSSTKAGDETQTSALSQYAAIQGGECRWYRDFLPGNLVSREAWDILMEGVRAGEVSRVVCCSLDRLGRSTIDLATLMDELAERNVNLVSLGDGVDLNGSGARALGKP